MLKTFIISFKLRMSYVVNNIIYSFKQIPLIGKCIPNDCYSDKGLKIFGSILAALKEIFWNMLIKRLIYSLFFLAGFPVLVQVLVNGQKDDPRIVGFYTTFILLSIIGAMINNELFIPSKDKYYAIFTMRIDTKKYVISNYLYCLIKNAIAILPFILLMGSDENIMPFKYLYWLPIMTIFIKIIFANIKIQHFNRTKEISYSKSINALRYGIIILLFLGAYLIPVTNFVITKNIFISLFIITSILGIFSFIELCKFNEYKFLCKKIFAEEKKQAFNFKKIDERELTHNIISNDTNAFISNKRGYAYFNELFVSRHKKILENLANLESIIIIGITAIAIILTKLEILANYKKMVNEFLLMSLPYLIYIMFLLNIGTSVTRAMFMNCDHSMLTYNFYRTPKAILGLFKERLKTLIKINLKPAIIIAISLPLLLFITGGTDNVLNYIVLFTSVISMSIFFSTHYLVMYYLLQPYNIEAEMKSATYKIVIGITFVVFYGIMDLKLPTIIFGLGITIFAFLYIIVSLALIYKFAPKTFKIRL